MNHSFNPMTPRLLVRSLAMAASVFSPSVRANDRHEHRGVTVFDGRREMERDVTLDARREDALSRLVQRIPAVRVDFDDMVASPKFVFNSEGFLSGPDDEEGISRPDIKEIGGLARAPADPHRPVKRFLDENADLFGYDSRILADARITRDYLTEHTGMRTVVWMQEWVGIPVFEAVLYGNIARNGELVSLSSQMVPEPVDAASEADLFLLVQKAFLPAEEAVAAAARSIGEDASHETVTPVERSSKGWSQEGRFTTPAIQGEARANLVWMPLDRHRLRLCWQVVLTGRTHGNLYQVLIDANTGDPHVQTCWTASLSPASYRIFGSDSPSPLTPGHSTHSTAQPSHVSQVLIQNVTAYSTTASPSGWINNGETRTIGNNVDARLDLFNVNPPYNGPLPTLGHPPRPENKNRVFDYVWNPSEPPLPANQSQYPNGSPNQNAAVVNAFYWCNWMHDRLYQLGFTEAAGNFQMDNFGRGGVGNDAVLVDVQDGAIRNELLNPHGPPLRNQNRMSSYPMDGIPPRMTLQLFDGPLAHSQLERDAALSAEVILHEYTHGMTMRLIGHGVGLSLGYPIIFGLDEGFADFFALALLSEAGDPPAGNYPRGGYLARNWKWNFGTGQVVDANYYYGFLLYPYSTSLSKNPLTFKDLDPAQGSQHEGVHRSPTYPQNLNSSANTWVKAQQLWGVTLWEVRANLVAAHGFPSGNNLAMQLVVDSLKLCPPNPNFLQARDALLLADRVYTGGANQKAIWQAFAKRGMGARAVASGSQTTSGIVENFETPPSSGALWTYSTGNAIYSSPAMGPDGSLVFGSADDHVYALHPDGTLKWTYSGAVGGWNFESSPAIASDGTVYIGGNDWRLYSLNSDGSLKWVRYLNGTVFSSPAIDKDGSVIVGVCHTRSNVVAYHANGDLKWSATTGNYVYSSPAIGSDGTVYVGSMDNKVYAYFTANGALKPGWPFVTGGAVYASPALGSDGTVYVGSFDGKVYALNPNGTKKWEFNTGAEVRSSPALGPDGTVYVGSRDAKVYALNGATGALKQGWPFTKGFNVSSSPCVGLDGTILIGSDDGKVYALNQDGSLRWAFNTGGAVFSSVVLGPDGVAYVGSSNGKLYALPTGTMLARNSWPMFRQNSRRTGTTPATVIFLGVDQCITEEDICIQGTWKGAFGSQGYTIVGNSQSHPEYFQVTPSAFSYHLWVASTADIRAPQKANGTDRIAACWYSADRFSVEINLTDSETHRVGFYFLDWDGNNQRRQRVDVHDAHSGFLIDSQIVSNFSGGAYFFWRMTGRARFEPVRLGLANSVVSGIFLDP